MKDLPKLPNSPNRRLLAIIITLCLGVFGYSYLNYKSAPLSKSGSAQSIQQAPEQALTSSTTNTTCLEDCCSKLAPRSSTTYTYYQDTGHLVGGESASMIDTYGYSGYEEGYNNPQLQCVRNTGPLPASTYTLSSCTDRMHDNTYIRPCSFVLTPVNEGEMCGRDSFLIHGCMCCTPGDSSVPPVNGCSRGCVVISYENRLKFRVGDTLVVRQYQKQHNIQSEKLM